MAFSKITNAQLNAVGATTQPDQPVISATALKAVFDAPAKQVCAPAHNTLVDELETGTAAASLGAQAPTGRTGNTVQGVINSVSDDLAAVESAMPGLVTDEHNHANKALLDTYTQTEADLASAVADDHTHTNKSLLDTYTQTETDLADAVTKKHDHSNKTALDKIGETSGRPTYNGDDIGGSVNNAFKTIKVGSTDIDASDEDTIELIEGSGITLIPDVANKTVKIESTGGGGGGGGDMTKANYANNILNPKTVDRAITLYDGTYTLAATIPQLNITKDFNISSPSDEDIIQYDYSAGEWKNVSPPVVDQVFDGTSANAQSGVAIEQKIDASIDQTYDGTSANAQSGIAVKDAIDTQNIHWIDATLSSGQQSYNITNALFKTTSRIVQVLSEGGYPYQSVDIAANGTCTITFSAALTNTLDVSIGISNAPSA